MTYDGYVEIKSATVPESLQKVFPQMGDIWNDNDPIKSVQGVALAVPLTDAEIAALDAAKASGEISNYTYVAP